MNNKTSKHAYVTHYMMSCLSSHSSRFNHSSYKVSVKVSAPIKIIDSQTNISVQSLQVSPTSISHGAVSSQNTVTGRPIQKNMQNTSNTKKRSIKVAFFFRIKNDKRTNRFVPYSSMAHILRCR